MRRKYAILRAPIESLPLGPIEIRDLDSGTPISLGIDELDTSEARALTEQEKDVLCIAPEFPITLIEPMSGSDCENREAWGIGAVGADRTHLTGEGVTVAVLDSGIDRTHPAFDAVQL